MVYDLAVARFPMVVVGAGYMSRRVVLDVSCELAFGASYE